MAIRSVRHMQRVFIVMATCALVAVVAPDTALAAGGTFTLTPASVSTTTGQTFSVKIDLNTGGEDTDGAKAILLFDKNLLEVSKITTGSIYSSYPDSGKVIDNATGSVKVTGIVDLNSDEAFNGTGTFATVDFTTKATGKATIKFDYVGPYDANNEATTRDSNIAGSSNPGADILTAVSSTSVTIASSTTSGNTASNGTTSGNLPSTATITPTVILASVGAFLFITGLAALMLL